MCFFYVFFNCFLQVFNEHPSRIISLEMIARLVSEAEDSLKLEHQVYSNLLENISYRIPCKNLCFAQKE
jgi:two-component sensor histidine kinase